MTERQTSLPEDHRQTPAGITKEPENRSGLGGGAEVAINYAMLGAFAIAISKSGITDLLAYKVITRMNKT